MYPLELEIKDTTESNTSASYLYLLLSIGRDGQLRTSLYDKRDDFNFHITNFPFLSSNIPSSPAYGVISQLIRYARACSSYECFITALDLITEFDFCLVQSSSEATGSWSLSPLIVSRDSFGHQTWARFQLGGAQPPYSDVAKYIFDI